MYLLVCEGKGEGGTYYFFSEDWVCDGWADRLFILVIVLHIDHALEI